MKNSQRALQKSLPQASIFLIQKIFLIGFVCLGATLFYFQIVRGDYFYERAKNNYVRVMPIRAIRGTIFDRNGQKLAFDRAAFNLSVIPYQVRNQKSALFEKLAVFTGYPVMSLENRYRRNFENPFSPVDIIINIDKSLALRAKETFNDLILIHPQLQRYYPFTDQSAHLLGYVKEAQSSSELLKKYGYQPRERIGFIGAEQYYDAYLRGEDGGDLIEVDSRGRMVGFLGKRIPQKGQNITLTIDNRLQAIAAVAIGQQRGALMLMDSRTGELLALYSSPSFDPNYFISGKNIHELLADKYSPLLNRAIQTTYPIGSTIKPMLALAALHEGKITPHTTFTCDGTYRLGAATFRCLKHHGPQDLYQAITHSCNIYFYNLGRLLGPDTISRSLNTFGFGIPTGVDLPYEKHGFVPDPAWKQKIYRQTWYTGDTLNFSIGQGYLQATSLQALVAMNIFASGGYLVTPHILKEVGQTPAGLQRNIKLAVNPNHITIVRQALRQVVSNETGTAHMLDSLPIALAGKTGTAQTSGKSHGWFVGFFPYQNPRVSLCVFLENGGSSYEALKVARVFLTALIDEQIPELSAPAAKE